MSRQIVGILALCLLCVAMVSVLVGAYYSLVMFSEPRPEKKVFARLLPWAGLMPDWWTERANRARLKSANWWLVAIISGGALFVLTHLFPELRSPN